MHQIHWSESRLSFKRRFPSHSFPWQTLKPCWKISPCCSRFLFPNSLLFTSKSWVIMGSWLFLWFEIHALPGCLQVLLPLQRNCMFCQNHHLAQFWNCSSDWSWEEHWFWQWAKWSWMHILWYLIIKRNVHNIGTFMYKSRFLMLELGIYV